MADEKTRLPEGTDKVVAGAEEPAVSNSGAVGVGDAGGTAGDEVGTLIISETTVVTEKEIPAPSGNAERPVTGSGSPQGGLAQRLRSGGEKLSSQAGEKARGLVGQGLERSAEALANVGRLVGDTATGLDERLGEDYGDYARRAASTIENAANSIASKDPDELIDDTREFVRRSPGVAIAGAAIVGFAIARLIKSGLARDEDDDEGDGSGSRGRGGRTSA